MVKQMSVFVLRVNHPAHFGHSSLLDVHSKGLPLKNEYKPDSIDFKILKTLAADSRIPFRRIGLELDLTTNTVKSRIDRMVSAGIIQAFTTKVNPAILGFKSSWLLVL